MILPCTLALFFAAQNAGAPKLQILDPIFQQFEDGPGMRPSAVYQDSETLFFSYRITGYRKNPQESIQLSSTIQAFDETGVPLGPADTKTIEAELAPEDKQWEPKVRYRLELPNTAICSACSLKVQLTDKIAGVTISTEPKFAIRGTRVEPSEKLTVRNFRFLRSDEDGPSMGANAAYRPGDALWARFEIIGFRHGEKNRVHVEYGLAVFRPSGKLLYEEPTAATANDTSFYPKRYLPGMLSLKLDEKLPPGEYPIVLKVRDIGSGQEFEEKYVFRLEN